MSFFSRKNILFLCIIIIFLSWLVVSLLKPCEEQVSIFDGWPEEKHFESTAEYLVYGVLKHDEYISSSGGFRSYLTIKVDKIVKYNPKRSLKNKVYKLFNWYLVDIYHYLFITGCETRKCIKSNEYSIGTKYPGNDMPGDYYNKKIVVKGIIFTKYSSVEKMDRDSYLEENKQDDDLYYIKNTADRNNFKVLEIILECDSKILEKIELK